MTLFSLAWMLGKPTQQRRGPLMLTIGAYTLVSALVLTVTAGALSFSRVQDDLTGLYQILAALAVVLLVIPLTVLGSAAARLSARSLDERLSTVRLLGATPGQVTLMTVIESAAIALAGALGGVVIYAALAPFVGLIHFQGSAIGQAMWLSPRVIALVVLGVLLVAVLSAALGLKRIIVSPLGVRNRVTVPTPKWIRVVIVAIVILGIYLAFSMLGQFRSAATMIAVLLGGIAFGLAALNLVGPWAVGRIGRAKLKRAETPAKLLAARMILESPTQSWRQVSGIAMTGFVAVVGGSGAALMNTIGVESSPDSGDALLAADIMTGVLITIVVSFLSVACSTAITQAATTLDRSELYAGLDRLGMPPATMEAARVGSVMIPVLGVGVGAAVISGVLVFPLVGIAIIMAPLSVGIILLTLAAGFVTVRGSVTLTSSERVLRTR